ncbi:GAF modulated Fis family sigma-54 specific transcriptional regulator [Neobacillus bataviensis LMG 21833]|uniref:GAF modulated Fis family sigma-54 specific transcriptional regulator n=1 Tax=Neobacillus bataviensis LMG 21833 TaxID=1117379 RepID=K6CIP3_9BACI|nr:sigma-54-dependent Fis family transcriptional regulator [Neobacillus bataviensis]EKN70990.1 GAF modulated Fis family sigma-54 specific transcriptional regulator [Neobacillus bataviensis LMG 21833]
MENIYAYKARVRSFEMSDREKILKKAWTNYFKLGVVSDDTRPVISTSWRRSQKYGINPNLVQAPICSPKVLRKKQEENKEILALIRPFMDDLFDIVKGTDSLIAFSDKDGVVLDLCGDSEIAINAAHVNFTVGVNMSEAWIGTNSIGLAMAQGKAVHVVGAEHYSITWHTSHCSSAPIKDPFTNEMIGVITLIGYVRSAHSHSLGLVKTAADTIVKLIEQKGIKKETYLLNNYFSAAIDSISDGIIIVNRLGEMIRINKIASHMLKIPLMDHVKWKLTDIEHLQPLSKYLEKAITRNEVILQDEFQLHNEEMYKILLTSRRIMVEGEHLGNIIILKKKKNKEMIKLSAKYTFSSLVGDDPGFKRAIKLASRAASTDKSVLIIGESGTGKELFAQAIHNESTRQTKPFIAINSAAIPKDLIASELFGYVDGAFTNAVKGGKKGKFEVANGGTIFLDEIGDMPLELQAHLLRVLEEKEVTPVGSNFTKPIDIRIIAATNKDLFSLVKENKFRLDLYYRLNVISINIPPLHKRKQDIELFVKHFLPTKTLSTGVLKCFYEYDWPGNLREMKNVMEQIEIFCDDPIVTEEYLPDYIKLQFEDKTNGESLYQSVANDTKKDTMIITLKNSKSVSEAANKLGVSSSTLYRWASEYQLNIKELIK